MMAEVVVDVLNSALGVTEDFGSDAPPGSRAIEIGSSFVRNPNLAHVFRVFGRPDRNLACDCERELEPTLPQALYLMTDSTVLAKMQAAALSIAKGKAAKQPPKGKAKVNANLKLKLGKGLALPPQDGRLAKLLNSNFTDDRILDELFLATLTRYPTAAERKYFADYRAARKPPTPPSDENPKAKKRWAQEMKTQRQAVFTDALWALLNTREFILNH
jgi:hypothetical protein